MALWLAVTVVLLGALGLVLTSGPTSHLTGPAPRPAFVPLGLGIPQFLLSELGSPNALTGGDFGYAVAISGNSVVVGAWGESGSGVLEAGNAYLIHLNQAGITTLESPDPQVEADFGYSVAVSGNTVVVGAPGEGAFGFAAAGAAYVYNATTGSLVESLGSPNPQTDGDFGESVAASGGTIVIGAPGEVAAGYAAAGHVYVVTINSPPLKMLASGDPITAGEFGYSVAVSGTTVVVGAPGESGDGVRDSGNVWTFNAATGDLITYYFSQNPQIGGMFGASVAISGTTIAVGAPYEDDVRAGAGGVYLINEKTESSTIVYGPNAQVDGNFGCSVALSGTTLVSGADEESDGVASGQGTVYTFSLPAGAQGAVLQSGYVSPNPVTSGSFGLDVAISGNTIAVGAPYEIDGGTLLAGHAYVFTNLPLTFTSPATLYGPSPTDGNAGHSVAVSGNYALVGAPGEPAGGTAGAGNAYLVNLLTRTVITLSDPSPQAGGEFGTSVAVASTMVAVGAPGETSGVFGGAGNVYLFGLPGGNLLRTLTSPNAQSAGAFGDSLAFNESSLIVGADGETASSDSAAGNAYLFTASTGALTGTLTSPNPISNGEFGESVAFIDSTAVVGAPLETAATFSTAGHAYVFDSSNGGLLATLTSPNAQVSGEFGYSVAVSVTTVVVGAPGEGTGLGATYLFNALNDVYTAALVNPDPSAECLFGSAVAVNGNTIVVGVPQETYFSPPDAGNVFIYSVSSDTVTDRYASPYDQPNGDFGIAVAVSGATIMVGAPTEESAQGVVGAGQAYVF